MPLTELTNCFCCDKPQCRPGQGVCDECDAFTDNAQCADPPRVPLVLTPDEFVLVDAILRHAEKHPSTHFVDVDASWPNVVSLRKKVDAFKECS